MYYIFNADNSIYGGITKYRHRSSTRALFAIINPWQINQASNRSVANAGRAPNAVSNVIEFALCLSLREFQMYLRIRVGVQITGRRTDHAVFSYSNITRFRHRNK